MIVNPPSKSGFVTVLSALALIHYLVLYMAADMHVTTYLIRVLWTFFHSVLSLMQY